MSAKSSIQLILFYMQSKEMFRLTPQLCRLAKKEFHDRNTELPDDVRNDASFDSILHLIEHIERSEFAKATELLGEAYKGHEDMLSYIPKQSNGVKDINTTSIFEDKWEPPPMRPGSIPTPPAVNHKLNEDDSRNWNDMSPMVTGKYDDNDADDSQPKQPKLSRSMDDSQQKQSQLSGPMDVFRDKRTYVTTLRPRDGKPDYETVYVSNSPAVLADKFTELHKSDWKAALGELSDVLGDKQAIRHMLWIVAKASIICASLATQQLQDLENSSVGILVSRDPLNKKVLVEEPLTAKMEKTVTKARSMLFDYRREIAKLSVPMLQKELRRAIISELGTSLPRRFTGIGNHFVEYANSCIEIIWLMYVHDPPMHLEWLTKEQEGSSFNVDLYDVYTRPGTLYDYCVWPVVRLHRDGPVLCKGVAQGR